MEHHDQPEHANPAPNRLVASQPPVASPPVGSHVPAFCTQVPPTLHRLAGQHMRLYPPKILLALASALLLLWVLPQEHWGACQWPFRLPAVRRPNPLQNAAFLLELCAKWTVEPPFFSTHCGLRLLKCCYSVGRIFTRANDVHECVASRNCFCKHY